MLRKIMAINFRFDPYVVNVQRDTFGNIVSGGIDNRKVKTYRTRI